MTNRAVILGARRTLFGRFGAALSTLLAPKLGGVDVRKITGHNVSV